jgi:predicted HicB family RNase H-like nuclease
MPPMPPPLRKVLYIRDAPADLTRKLKGAAALQGISLQQYVVETLQAHVAELERKGHLPKSK